MPIRTAAPIHTAAARALAALCLLAPAMPVFAGPLNPPAGPIASTSKPLSEVEPRVAVNASNTPGDATASFVITQPGSYYLTGNLTGATARHGIRIAASNVTLDLNGFALIGGVAGSQSGVVCDGGQTNITVRNGAVHSWNQGVDLSAALTGSLIDGVVASGNAVAGIRGAPSGVIRACVARANGGHGIAGGVGGLIESCVSHENNGAGFAVGAGATARACLSRSNSSAGFGGASNAIIVECSAISNGTAGFDLGAACIVERCVSNGNNGNGIVHFNDCVIRANVCDGNVFSGIYSESSDSRLEANQCTDNSRAGVEVEGTGNIVIRNTCSGNATNWIIGSLNAVAPIVSANQNANAINGNTYSGNLGSADPNANFTH